MPHPYRCVFPPWSLKKNPISVDLNGFEPRLVRLTGRHAPRGVAAAEDLHALKSGSAEWENMWFVVVDNDWWWLMVVNGGW